MADGGSAVARAVQLLRSSIDDLAESELHVWTANDLTADMRELYREAGAEEVEALGTADELVARAQEEIRASAGAIQRTSRALDEYVRSIAPGGVSAWRSGGGRPGVAASGNRDSKGSSVDRFLRALLAKGEDVLDSVEAGEEKLKSGLEAVHRMVDPDNPGPTISVASTKAAPQPASAQFSAHDPGAPDVAKTVVVALVTTIAGVRRLSRKRRDRKAKG